jgi:MFS transporter, UMF1 family
MVQTPAGVTADERRSIRGWAFYDWAESAFTTSILVAVLPIYYLSIAPTGPIVFNIGPWQMQTAASSLWAYAVSASTLLIALPSPILGAIADIGGRRKRFLGVFAYIGALFSAMLVFAGNDDYLFALMLFMVANMASVGGNIFYNALLLDVAPQDRLDSISSKGFAYGYAGGGILLIINLAMVSQPGWFGIPSTSWAARICFLSVGVWWAVFTVPTLLWVRETPSTDRVPIGRYVVIGTKRVVATLHRLFGYRDLTVYLLAFLIYNDGIQTVIVMAVPYGKEVLGLTAGTLMGTLVVIQIVGIPGSMLFGRAAERWGAKRTILAGLVIWSVVVIYAWRMEHAWEFWILGVFVGFVMGGTQAVSRSLFGRLIPAGQNAEFFGFLAMSSRFASFIGPLVFGLARDLTGSMRAGIVALIVFFLVGMIVLTRVDVDRGSAEALGDETA